LLFCKQTPRAPRNHTAENRAQIHQTSQEPRHNHKSRQHRSSSGLLRSPGSSVRVLPRRSMPGRGRSPPSHATAGTLGEHCSFSISPSQVQGGWRSYFHGTLAAVSRNNSSSLHSARLHISTAKLQSVFLSRQYFRGARRGFWKPRGCYGLHQERQLPANTRLHVPTADVHPPLPPDGLSPY